jgi:hypothetical protein
LEQASGLNSTIQLEWTTGGFLKWGYPQELDGLEWTILLRWMIWGCSYFRKPPTVYLCTTPLLLVGTCFLHDIAKLDWHHYVWHTPACRKAYRWTSRCGFLSGASLIELHV